MSFLIDANVLIYRLTDSVYREPCRAVVLAVANGEVEGRVSTAVLEEVWHLELRGRLAEADGATKYYCETLSPILSITEDILRRAIALDVGRALGANDRIHAATCLELGLRTIVSADAAFDGVRGLKRVDPLDERAVARLLRSSPKT